MADDEEAPAAGDADDDDSELVDRMLRVLDSERKRICKHLSSLFEGAPVFR